MNSIRILIVNEDKLARKSLYELLCRSGFAVDLASCAKEASAYLNENLCHIVIVDINGVEPSGLIKSIKGRQGAPEIIILTSYGNVETAVNSIKLGAFDYLVRPIEDKKIISTIEKALANKVFPQTKPVVVKKFSKKENGFHGLVGQSPAISEIYSIIERISNSRTTVLLRGESGTGKRMIARGIHRADKKRRDKAFVEISCGALPKEIIESELFGHSKGAFTGAINDRKGRFELAHGGTILLDDIDSLSMDLQVKLLRVLQEKEFERVGENRTIKVDVRIIASTNQELEKAVAEKRFREDLYYRLNVISIRIPSLRDRKDDLPLLVEHFVSMYSKENNKKTKAVSQDVMDILTNYDWPGNIRELENIIERAVILDTDSIIAKEDLPEIILTRSVALSPSEAINYKTDDNIPLKDALKEPEKVYILKILEEAGWNKKKAAKKLGVNRTTLYNKLRKYDLLA